MPKTVWEQRVHGFKQIVDWATINLPKYNPYQFELCRNLDGLPRYAFAKRAGLTTRRYKEIETGESLPTDEAVTKILKSQTHVTGSFFEKWPETKLDFNQVVAVPVAIDYYQYKVFRNINPRMKSV